MSERTRLLAVDDHPTVRSGLSLLFQEHEDLELISDAETGEEALDEVVIMDVRLPGIDGISAI